VSDGGFGGGISETELAQFAREPVFSGIPDAERSHLAAIARRQTVSSGSFFLREGDVPDRVAYVGRGLFRVFFITAEGEERIPQYLVASFLGISPVTLSRIRRSLLGR
jgi:hypothetical protein